MKSILPPVGEVKAAQSMRIYRTTIDKFKYTQVKTHIEFVDETTGERTNASPNVYRIDDEKILGYMPSKIWHHEGTFNLLFYTSPMMPDTARPFGNAPCYAFTLFVRDGTSVEYDWQTRIFIDQIPTIIGMAYVFIFAEADAKSIMQTQWDGTPWEIERPHLSADDISWYSEATAVGLARKDIMTINHLQDSMPKDEFLDNLFKPDPGSFICDASDSTQC